MNLQAIQSELWKWEQDNFDVSDLAKLKLQLALGVCEEAGELAHAVLKESQGIREGTDPAKVHNLLTDAVGDVFIFMSNLCSCYGINLLDEIYKTALEVMKRNWSSNKKDGS